MHIVYSTNLVSKWIYTYWLEAPKELNGRLWPVVFDQRVWEVTWYFTVTNNKIKPEVHVKVFDKYTVFNRESPWVLTPVNHKRNLSSPRERERKGDGRVALLCKPGTRFNNTLRSKTSIIYTMSGPTMKKEREREKTTLFNVSTA